MNFRGVQTAGPSSHGLFALNDHGNRRPLLSGVARGGALSSLFRDTKSTDNRNHSAETGSNMTIHTRAATHDEELNGHHR